ncbi:hypothetical protein PLIIFM63780_010484 [Purpureocillium lilacinum]|nr:hypothetical protein PLIIFM63780_010484 [Purpureocillium lilacinum]
MTTATDIRPETPDHIEEGPRGKNATNYDLVDKEVAEYVNETRIQIDDSTNRRLKRMIDKRILAVMIVTYFTQALDKGTMSFASIMGIIEDTNLASNQYSWFTTIIFLIILVVEYPTNFILQRLPIGKYLAANIILWGTRKKSKLAQILGGLLAFAFSFVPKESPLKAWQALFMTYGVATVFWGVFVLFWIPDSPMRAKCWSEEDKKLMVERVRENRTGVQNRVFRKEQIVHALKDPQVYAFALIQFCTTLPSGGFGAYASIIIKSFGFTTWQTQLLQMPTGVVMICVMLTSVWADRKFKQTILIMMVGVLPTIAGTVALISVPFEPSKRVGLLIAYYAMYSFWVCSGLALSLVSRNVAGQTKKTAVIASNFVFWAMGNSIGPQCFRDKDKPRYFMALSIVLGCFILLEVVLIVLRTYYVWMNKRRDAMVASGEVVADVDFAHSFEDITDNQNPHFRYSY